MTPQLIAQNTRYRHLPEASNLLRTDGVLIELGKKLPFISMNSESGRRGESIKQHKYL